MNTYGIAFHQLRKERGYTLINTAKGIMSKSGLSKFERGESDISLSKFLALLERIGIKMEEFEYYANGYKHNEFRSLIIKIERACTHRDLNLLKYLANTQKEKYQATNDIKCHLISIMITIMYDNFAETKITSSKDLADLNDYFFSLTNWSYFELSIFCNVMSGLNRSTLKMLLQELIHKSHNFSEITDNNKLILIIIINSTFVFFEDEDYPYCQYLLKVIDNFIEEKNFYYRFLVLLMQECVKLKINNRQSSGKMDELQNVLKILAPDTLIINFQHYINKHLFKQNS